MQQEHIKTQILEQGDPGKDMKGFRRCLGQFSTGVTIMTTQVGGQPIGLTANSFSSLSMDPPLVMWAIGRTSRSFNAFTTSKYFNINVLSSEQIEMSQVFASKADDKFREIEWTSGEFGTPILPSVLATFECELTNVHEGGDHMILIGRVKKYTRFLGNALLYAQGRYALAEDHPNLIIRSADNPAALPNDSKTSPRAQMRFTTLLSLVGLSISAAFDEVRRTESLDLPQGRVLFTLRNGITLSLEEIIQQSYLTRPSVEDAISSLTDKNCILRRASGYALSEKGQLMFSKVTQQFGNFENEQLAGITPGNLSIARDVLQTLHSRLISVK